MRPELNVKVFGEGEPLIILHGLFGMLDNWQTIGKRLADAGWMVYLIDQRDHGRSSHTTAFSYDLLAGDLLHFMEENWIHSATLIGHSMGGKTALAFSAQHEDMVSRLIVVDMGIKQYKGGHHDVFDALFAVDLSQLSARDEAEAFLMSRLHHQGTVQFLMKNLTRTKEGGFAWKMNLPLLYREYDNILSAIPFSHVLDIPAFFIRGELSDYIEEADIPAIRAVLPRSEYITIPGAGHWVHADKPDELFHVLAHCIRKEM